LERSPGGGSHLHGEKMMRKNDGYHIMMIWISENDEKMMRKYDMDIFPEMFFV